MTVRNATQTAQLAQHAVPHRTGSWQVEGASQSMASTMMGEIIPWPSPVTIPPASTAKLQVKTALLVTQAPSSTVLHAPSSVKLAMSKLGQFVSRSVGTALLSELRSVMMETQISEMAVIKIVRLRSAMLVPT